VQSAPDVANLESRRTAGSASAARSSGPRQYNHRLIALTPGTRFGRCEILSAQGAGGVGVVYRARESSKHPGFDDIDREPEIGHRSS
jgi:hypothetical protein